MKILHTSDWHIGQNFYRYDREEEFIHFFDQLGRIISDEKPDIMLVSGDIFDTAAPSISSVRLYNRAMIDFSRNNPHMAIVVTAGNHDSANRLEVNGELWSAFNVHVSGTVKRDGNGQPDASQFIIPIKGEDGKPKAVVVAVPYISQYGIPGEGDTLQQKTQDMYSRLLQKARETAQGAPVIAMGHLTASSAALSGERCIGGQDAVSADVLDCGYEYFALGHIHKPQKVGGHDNIRYSGSPIPLSFDEQYPHSATIVTIEEGSTETRLIEISPLYGITDIPEKAAPFDNVKQLMAQYPADRKTYIRAKVKITDKKEPNMYPQLEQCLEGKQARLCLVAPEFADRPQRENEVARTMHEFRRLSPEDIAQHVYQENYACNMPEDIMACFREAVEEANENL